MISVALRSTAPPVSRAANSAGDSSAVRSSPSTTPILGARSPCACAIAWMRAAAAEGLAAPKLPMILIPSRRHRASTGPTKRSSAGL
jgi:hypothetical protein